MGETMWMVRAKMDIQCSPRIVKGFTVFKVYTVGSMPNMNALIKVLEGIGYKGWGGFGNHSSWEWIKQK